jgi:acyl carrier protein
MSSEVMERTEIYDRVKKVVVEELGVKEEEVTESASFTEDLGADSLDLVELVMALEEEFGIDIPDDEVNSIKTVGDAINYIENKKKE